MMSKTKPTNFGDLIDHAQQEYLRIIDVRDLLKTEITRFQTYIDNGEGRPHKLIHMNYIEYLKDLGGRLLIYEPPKTEETECQKLNQ